MATVSFFFAWGVAVQQLYKDEINAGIVKKPMLVSTMILSFLVLLLAFCFRIYTGCESYLSAAGGTIIGFLFGFMGCIALGYATNRKATNIWGIPLLRSKTKDKRG
jgi:peptidoglycan/LPS O-acetylase OafA/YrhL